jgi:hypothetical protein
LLRLRNVSEHIDEYNLDQGRDDRVSRRQVQTWYLNTADSGGPIWGWLGQRLDIEQTEDAALSLYRGFLSDLDTWTGAAPTGIEHKDQPAPRRATEVGRG